MLVEELWENFLTNVKKEINPASYDAWFSDLKLVRLDNDSLTIQVPMEIHKTMLGSNYYSLMEEILFKLSGITYDIKFVSKDEKMDEEKVIISSISNESDTKVDTLWQSNLDKSLTFDNYVVGDSNRFAKMAGMAVAEEPGKIHNPLFIYGKCGIGKTHLMHAIGNFITEATNKKVLYTTSDNFTREYVGISKMEKGKDALDSYDKLKDKYRNVDVLIIDDIQYLVGSDKTQEEFFHTFNALHTANKQIIVSSDRSPNDLKLIEERLRSRFMFGLPININPPDFDLRVQIIKQNIKGNSIENKIDEAVIEFIANSCQNDVRFLKGTINRLMAYTAMMVPERIDLEFANEALRDWINVNIYSDNSIENIQKAVAEFYQLTVEDLKGKKRNAKIAYARQIAMYLSRIMTDETVARIGLEFGGKDHSTVIHNCDKIKEDIINNKVLEQEINEIKSKF